jgi:hypothetical protein
VLRFQGFNEAGFVGGGMNPLRTDVGLWVINQGKLDLQGAVKTSWTQANGAIAQGARSVQLDQPPVGWAAGDELVVTPTARGDFNGFDVAAVSSVDQASVGVNAPLARAHPLAGPYSAEVANLSRNVRIEGTSAARSHVFMRSSAPQTINYVELRHMGVRDVAGRYPLHFHMAGDGSRGSQVTGTVVRDAGHHAFVAHMSNGITFRDTVAFNVTADPYWWDPPPHAECRAEGDPRRDPRRPVCSPSKSADVAIVHGLAAKVPGNGCCLSNIPNSSRLSGFELSDGPGNSVTDSVAVGVASDNAGQASGFEWPEGSGVGDAAVWTFDRNRSHNNVDNGLFVWQNVAPVHPVDNFVGYNNGKQGIDHGAYSNQYRYTNAVLFGNGRAPMQQRATSKSDPGMQIIDTTFDAKGSSQKAGIVDGDHRVEPKRPTLYLRPRIVDADHAVAFIRGEPNGPNRIDVVCPTLVRTPNIVRFSGGNSGNVLRWQTCDGKATEYTPANPNGRSIPRFR